MLWKAARVVSLLAILTTAASANVLIWTVSNATFDDGGTLNGSFGYDADLNAFSSINLITTPGSLLGGASYVAIDPCCTGGGLPNADFLLFVTQPSGDLTGTPLLIFELLDTMTNAGGSIDFDIAAPFHEEGTCVAGCASLNAPDRQLVSGTLSAPTPEPGTFFLTVPLAAMALWLRRRRPVRAS
jgi:hypothetical protein